MKWYVYLICFILVIAGAFCGIRLYQLVTAESYVNGSIDIENQFTMESFSYANTAVEFYHDVYDTTDTYAYSVDLRRVDDFNGADNTYQVTLNGYYILDAQITAGSVFCKVNMEFYDTDGNLIHTAFVNVSVKFLSDKTALTVSTMMHGEYGISDVCLSTLNLVGKGGVRGKIMSPLNAEEVALLNKSADSLKNVIANIEI